MNRTTIIKNKKTTIIYRKKLFGFSGANSLKQSGK